MPKKEAVDCASITVEGMVLSISLEYRRLCYMSEVIDIELQILVFP